MKFTVIVQTVQYTGGIFHGQITKQYIRCYTERDKLRYMSFAQVWGSPVKLLKAEVLK